MRYLQLLCVLCVMGCLVPEDMATPESVGNFDIGGTLMMNTCGFAAVSAPDPLNFSAELLTVCDGDATSCQAMWRRPGATTIWGSAQSTEYDFLFQTSAQIFPADPVTQTAGCSVLQSETLNLKKNDDSMDMTGSNRIELIPTTGSRCERALTVWGGLFEMLPCFIEYELEVTESDTETE